MGFMPRQDALSGLARPEWTPAEREEAVRAIAEQVLRLSDGLVEIAELAARVVRRLDVEWELDIGYPPAEETTQAVEALRGALIARHLLLPDRSEPDRQALL